MAKCDFCYGPLDDQGAQAICRLCDAEYEYMYKYPGSNRVVTTCIKEPEPEKYNLGLVRKRLLECARHVVTKPSESLRLLEDIWVELCNEVRPGDYSVMGELRELRTNAQMLKDTIKTLEEKVAPLREW